MTTRTIPTSVLAILKHGWKDANPDYSSFESLFNDADDRGRRSDPGYYRIRHGKGVDHEGDVLTHDEAAALGHG